MKYALIIPDGCADEPQANLGGRTPLQAARLPNMDAIVTQGVIGRTETVPESMSPGSDVGTMSLFGYDPLRYHTGRAPIEAAAQGIELSAGDWAIRCNLVTVLDGIMRSFTAGQYPSNLAAGLIERLCRDQCGNQHWKFYAGVSYRNLLIYRARGEAAPFTAETHTLPPHDITDQPIEPSLPSGAGSKELRELMDRSVGLFAHSEETQTRANLGTLPATQIWLWGQGSRPEMEPFESRFGKTGAVITAVDLLRGLAKLIGCRVVNVPGATGYLDTDYAAKGRFAIKTLDEVDFVVVHVEATDEASHEGDAEAKIAALENIDRHIVGPVHEALRRMGEYRILVSPDHPTLLRTKTHSHGAVPFTACGTGITPDAATTYDEGTAGSSPFQLSAGHEMLPWLFSNKK